MKTNWRLKPDDLIGCRVVFYHGRTNRRFVPYSPPWARLTSNRFTIAGRWVVGMSYWVDYWVACLPSRHAVSFESNNRLTASPTSIRASLFNAPSIDLALTRHQGVLQVVPGLVSRWRRGGMHATLVSSWCRSEIHGLEGRATSVWVMITPGRFTSTDRPNGYIDVVLKYIL